MYTIIYMYMNLPQASNPYVFYSKSARENRLKFNLHFNLYDLALDLAHQKIYNQAHTPNQAYDRVRAHFEAHFKPSKTLAQAHQCPLMTPLFFPSPSRFQR